MTVMTTDAILHLFWCYLFVNILHWDIFGVSIATCIFYSMNFIIITIYCSINKELKSSFFFPGKESFMDLKEYMRLCIPSLLTLWHDVVSHEGLGMLAGFISVNAMASMVIT